MRNTDVKVWILLLNWRNAKDTFECLDSIDACIDHEIAGVVLCDNGSNDGSLEAFQKWLQDKTWPYTHYQYQAGEFIWQASIEQEQHRLPLVLIDNQSNLGFAGGNNIGLQFIQTRLEYDFVYLLNNDTLIEANTVSSMVAQFEQNPKMGLCGSKVIYAHTPTKVQAYGGARFNRYLGRAVNLGAMANRNVQEDIEQVRAHLDYILGASTMISKSFLETVGGMEERYFLYYEEIDWAVRAKRAGFVLGYAPDSIVFHKEGASIGSSFEKTGRSPLSAHYMITSKLRFTAKFYPFLLPFVISFSILQTIRAFVQGQKTLAKVMFKAILMRPFK